MINQKSRIKEHVLAIITHGNGVKKFIRGSSDKYNVLAIVRDKYGEVKSIIKAKNVITNDGDLFYAQKGCGATPTYAFINCILGTGTAAEAKTDVYNTLTVIGSTEKAPSSGYPKVNDSDADNTGKAADSITYKYIWLGADFNNAAIAEGAIVISGAAAGAKVLTRFKFAAAFEKSVTDTLTLYLNHNFLGV